MAESKESKAENAEAEDYDPEEDPNVQAAERDAELLNKQTEVNAAADEAWSSEPEEDDEEPEPEQKR